MDSPASEAVAVVTSVLFLAFALIAFVGASWILLKVVAAVGNLNLRRCGAPKGGLHLLEKRGRRWNCRDLDSMEVWWWWWWW